MIHCLGRLPTADADALREAIRAGGADLGRRVLAALERTQSLAYARYRADEYVKSARLALEHLPPSESRAVMEQLTEWSARREK